jgi:hypothetical protein
VDKNKVKYSFESDPVKSLKQNSLRETFGKIGKFSKITRDLGVIADRCRFWIEKLTDVRKNETNYSNCSRSMGLIPIESKYMQKKNMVRGSEICK